MKDRPILFSLPHDVGDRVQRSRATNATRLTTSLHRYSGSHPPASEALGGSLGLRPVDVVDKLTCHLTLRNEHQFPVLRFDIAGEPNIQNESSLYAKS